MATGFGSRYHADRTVKPQRSARWPAVILILFVFALFAAACGATSVTDLAGPSERCVVALSVPAHTVTAAGGTVNTTVGVARECGWTATSDVPWITLAPTSGQGEAAVTLTVLENENGLPRNATVTVNDFRLTIAQQAADCHFSLS